MRYQKCFRCVSLLLSLLFCLAGCADPTDPADHADTTQIVSGQQEPFVSSTPSPEPSGQPVDDKDEEPSPGIGLYTVKVPDADRPIYSKPYDRSAVVGTVGEAGVYTITEEVHDAPHLWGKLLSGLGWIDVSGLSRQYLPHVMLTAGIADESLLAGDFHECVVDVSEYGILVAFFAHHSLHSFTLYNTTLTDQGLKVTDALYALPELTPEKPLVTRISFPGDLSAYAVSFTDEAGTAYLYSVSQSGRDGSIFLSEFSDP